MNVAQKNLAPIASIVLVVLVAIAAFVSFQHTSADHAARAIATARGTVGSEKKDFFADPDVVAEFRKSGIMLDITTEGSREQATTATKEAADFYFPAGEPAGRAIAQKLGIKDATTPFYTPMIIASWNDIASVLSKDGIIHKSGKYWYVSNMQRLLDIIESGKRWNQFAGNTTYDVGKAVIISTTDVRKSNSAGMYLALASYVLNGNEIINNAGQSRRIQQKLNNLFLKQGFQESSSSGPFADYVSIGEGKDPMVLCYEQQFIEYLATTTESSRPPGMIALYPKPTIFTKHTIVPTDEIGRKVATVLEDDPIMRALEIRHGFRNADTAATRDFWSRTHIDLPDRIQDVIEPPRFSTMETMIKGVDDALPK